MVQANWRDLLLPIAAMVVIVVSSNILVQTPVNDWLTWGALTYPISFLVNELTNRRFGPDPARKVVYVGFFFGVAISYYLAGERIALASGTAFLVAQLLDIFIFDRLRRSIWWRAPFAASVLSSTADTALFFSLAFAGTAVPWVTLGLGDLAIKLTIAVILLAPFRAFMTVVRPAA